MGELLPCPFCGGEASSQTTQIGHEYGCAWVQCHDCLASTDDFEAERAPLAEAESAWNRRTTRPTTPS